MAKRGTTGQTAARFMTISNKSRPATGGNKNTGGSARRKSAMSQKGATAGIFSGTHTGPYLGKTSL